MVDWRGNQCVLTGSLNPDFPDENLVSTQIYRGAELWQIRKERGLVFFYTFQGPTDSFSGFVYVRDESQVNDFREKWGHPIFYDGIQLKRMSDHWYFVVNS